MSRVMQIGAQDDLYEKARRAVCDADRSGQRLERWVMGRQVYDQFRHGNRDYCSTTQPNSLLGLPFVVKVDGPPDLLELESRQ